MKKATIILGIISSLLFLLSVAFKIQHWPGATIALCISIVLFALGYSPLLMIDRNRLTQNSNQKLINLASMIGMTVIAISFLFKLMHWPGAGVGVIIGNLILVVLIPFLFFHALKESEPIKRLNFFNEAILLVFLTGFSFSLWMIIGKA